MATKPSLLTTLSEQKKVLGHKTMSRDSIAWLNEKIKEIRKPVSVANAISKEKDRKVSTIRLGMMYCYYYDAKTKDDLPYWDRFPVIIVLEKYGDGFLGMNLHYLPPKFRAVFMQKLMRYAMLDDKDEIHRIRATYDIMNATKRLAEFKPCLKRYLYSNIRSKILKINANEWDVAGMLPLQQFKKARAQTVWKDSVLEYKEELKKEI